MSNLKLATLMICVVIGHAHDSKSSPSGACVTSTHAAVGIHGGQIWPFHRNARRTHKADMAVGDSGLAPLTTR